MSRREALRLGNGGVAPLAELPSLPLYEFREEVLRETGRGGRLVALFWAAPVRGLVAVLADAEPGPLRVLSTVVERAYAALTPECPQAHRFEREVHEQAGIVPEGHPWLKPVRFVHSELPAVTDFFEVEGAEAHEVGVGPVHAGIIEPGHFRFQCHGEVVLHLEIAFGYQHRGVERALLGGPSPRTIHHAETLAGDTTVGHATAHCRLLEALSGTPPSARAEAVRGVALELERLANHVGDLGALAGDVGYLPTASFCGRLRGDYLNMTGLACGSRFGRGWIRPGGVGFDLDEERARTILDRLGPVFRDTEGAASLLFGTPSVQARFEETGRLTTDQARDLGLVGPAARACGLSRDVRLTFPWGVYAEAPLPLATAETGDVQARAWVRWLEVQHSVAWLRERLRSLPEGEPRRRLGPLAPGRIAVALVEAWRGEVAHVAITGEDGRFASYKVVDPSFQNWVGLAIALRGQPISDFPLCNKSFNLSYCGYDL